MTGGRDRDVVHLWYRATDALDPAATAAAVSALCHEERERHDRLVFARDRRDYAEAHALLRRALTRRGGQPPESWRFERSAHGKPSLAADGPTPLRFNLSHTDGLVACAVGAGAEIGVDAEAVRRIPYSTDMAERHFSPVEMAQLQSLSAPARDVLFIELWTLKEAFVKAVGGGLTDRMDQPAFDLSADGTIGFTVPAGEQASAWSFALFAPTNRHRIALALRWADDRQRSGVVARTECDPRAVLLPTRSSDQPPRSPARPAGV